MLGGRVGGCECFFVLSSPSLSSPSPHSPLGALLRELAHHLQRLDVGLGCGVGVVGAKRGLEVRGLVNTKRKSGGSGSGGCARLLFHPLPHHPTSPGTRDALCTSRREGGGLWWGRGVRVFGWRLRREREWRRDTRESLPHASPAPRRAPIPRPGDTRGRHESARRLATPRLPSILSRLPLPAAARAVSRAPRAGAAHRPAPAVGRVVRIVRREGERLHRPRSG